MRHRTSSHQLPTGTARSEIEWARQYSDNRSRTSCSLSGSIHRVKYSQSKDGPKPLEIEIGYREAKNPALHMLEELRRVNGVRLGSSNSVPGGPQTLCAPPGGGLASCSPMKEVHALKVLAGSVIAAGLLLGAAPAASADEASFTQYVNDNGVRMPFWNDAQMYGAGVKICGLLRDGMTPQQISDGQGPLTYIDNMKLIQGAQQHICPGTIR